MERKSHWETVFTTKDSTQVSWYQQHLGMSLRLIEKTNIPKSGHIIDVGGGTSTLVDDLLGEGYEQITVLDISGAALQQAHSRLGSAGDKVNWLEVDITQVALPEHQYDLWHDRAVFHFLTDPEDRHRYVEQVKRALKPEGHIIVATFAADGPSRCSGLDTVQYSSDTLHGEFGDSFELVESLHEDHATPFGTQQSFIYCCCLKH